MNKKLLLAALLTSSSVFAQSPPADVPAKRAEIRHAVDASLKKFYTEQPRIKSEVAGAPGYAVFTTYGVSFLVGGSGGKGLAHDADSKKDTYMEMAQVSAGLQAGIAQNQTLIVFKTRKAFDNFVKNGWEFGGGATASAGAGGKTAGKGVGEQFVDDAMTYTYTKKGVEAGAALAGTKFARDKDLN